MTSRSGLATGFALLATALPGQELRVLDSTGIYGAVHDPIRGRILAISFEGETRGFDGGRWYARPEPRFVTGRFDEWAVAFDDVRGHPLLCLAGPAREFELHHHDGVRWLRIQSGAGPSPRTGFAHAFDSQRGEFVLFGGELPTFVTSDETWVWDGTAWTRKLPAASPPPRMRAVMAYDAVRARTVMLGGFGAQVSNTTWEWDGASWIPATPATAPVARAMQSMTFDPSRGKVVMFGGLDGSIRLDELWEYDGIDWVQHVVTPRPGPRHSATLLFDPDIGEVRMINGADNFGPITDTWSWDGVRWLQHALPAVPGVRGVGTGGAVAVADPLGRGLVLYEGRTQPAPRSWLWDGLAWSQVAGAAPPERTNAAVCSGASGALLYGGYSAAAGTRTDLWRFDGAAWTPEAQSGPTPALGGAIAGDLGSGEVVLFGGATSTGTIDETWVFDGQSWSLRQPATRPSARYWHAMAFDPIRLRTVMVGGIDGAGVSQPGTWEWDGTDWTLVTTVTNTPPAVTPSLVFDVQRARPVLLAAPAVGAPLETWSFDGADWEPVAAVPPVDLNWWASATGWPYPHGVLITDETSVFALSSTNAATSRFGAACTPGAPDLSASEWPRIGVSSLGIEVVRAPASSVVALLGATATANVNVAGCTQLVQPGQAVALLPTSATGFASAPLPLPNDAGFVGVSLYFQAAALDAAAPSGFTLSTGLRVGIGN